MTLVFACHCGKLLHGRDDNGLVTAVTGHLTAGHRMTLSRDQILALAQRVDAGGGAWHPAPDERQTSDSRPPAPRSYGRGDSGPTGPRHPTDARSDHHEHGDD